MFSTAFLDLPPLRRAAGTVRLPGSKSISNRVLLLAGLAQGTTAVHDLLDSDDTRVMLAALEALGCSLRRDEAAGCDTGTGRDAGLGVQHAGQAAGAGGLGLTPACGVVADGHMDRPRRPGQRGSPLQQRHAGQQLATGTGRIAVAGGSDP
mgnify:CR=1 FL=1